MRVATLPPQRFPHAPPGGTVTSGKRPEDALPAAAAAVQPVGARSEGPPLLRRSHLPIALRTHPAPSGVWGNTEDGPGGWTRSGQKPEADARDLGGPFSTHTFCSRVSSSTRERESQATNKINSFPTGRKRRPQRYLNGVPLSPPPTHTHTLSTHPASDQSTQKQVAPKSHGAAGQ